jgi:hypothetical protein
MLYCIILTNFNNMIFFLHTFFFSLYFVSPSQAKASPVIHADLWGKSLYSRKMDLSGRRWGLSDPFRNSMGPVYLETSIRWRCKGQILQRLEGLLTTKPEFLAECIMGRKDCSRCCVGNTQVRKGEDKSRKRQQFQKLY